VSVEAGSFADVDVLDDEPGFDPSEVAGPSVVVASVVVGSSVVVPSPVVAEVVVAEVVVAEVVVAEVVVAEVVVAFPEVPGSDGSEVDAVPAHPPVRATATASAAIVRRGAPCRGRTCTGGTKAPPSHARGAPPERAPSPSPCRCRAVDSGR